MADDLPPAETVMMILGGSFIGFALAVAAKLILNAIAG
jgi:hypothetical protein